MNILLLYVHILYICIYVLYVVECVILICSMYYSIVHNIHDVIIIYTYYIWYIYNNIYILIYIHIISNNTDNNNTEYKVL